MVNYNNNNPTNINEITNSYSVIVPPSLNIDNPFINSNQQNNNNNFPYGYFGSANPEIESRLPHKINLGPKGPKGPKGPQGPNNNLQLGITSPGTIDKATACDGLDFVNTNPDYDKIPLEYCLQKFGEHYQIPGIAFDNLLNNLPYTFSALTNEQKNSYLSKLKDFVNKESSKLPGNKVEHFGNNKKENYGNSNVSNYSNDSDCSNSNISLSGVLCIIVIIVIIILFLLFIAKKN